MTDVSAVHGRGLPLTGERTVPGVPEENYWFRRHEVVYREIASACAGALVLEAGCGEGYGAAHLAGVARGVLALDYDEPTVAHVLRRYPGPHVARADLSALPVASSTVDVVVSLQVIEHLADQPGFLAECRRVLRPGGTLVVSTPNRITFSPGQDVPLNPFHTRELDPSELDELLRDAGFATVTVSGLHHGERLRALDSRHGGSVITAQLQAVYGALPGQAGLPEPLGTDIASVTADDFELRTHDLAASLDLVAVCR